MNTLVDSLSAIRERGAVRVRPVARQSVLRRVDWLLLGAALLLCAVGALLVWSATRGYDVAHGRTPRNYVHRDVINVAVGLALGAAVALAGRRLRAWAAWIYAGACVGLVAVLSPLGATINGSHSWIVLGGGFQLQPAEFAKVALVVSMAAALSGRRAAARGPRHRDVVRALALAAVPIGLIVLQPDLGTVMVLGFIVAGLLAMSGAPVRWLVGLALAAGLAGGAVAQLHLLKDYQVKRFTAFANPGVDPRGFGYNATQARITVGSGGLTGTGLLRGPQTNGHFVPEQHTDFIFTVAGEELGFVGSGGIIVLVGVVLWRALRIAGRAADRFGALVCVGVVCWFAFQSFQNIGMTLGIMPITGLPLPFVSYGGSSMIANLVAIGLLQNVALSARLPR